MHILRQGVVGVAGRGAEFAVQCAFRACEAAARRSTGRMAARRPRALLPGTALGSSHELGDKGGIRTRSASEQVE